MQVHADQVAVQGPHAPLLPPTSLRVAAGQLALVSGEPGGGHTAFGLALTGRIRPSVGTVTPDAAQLRRVGVLVDAPGVTEPEDGLIVADVVAEELALAGVRPSRRAVATWLDEHDAAGHRRDRFESVPAALRTRLLTELAAARPDTRLLVLDTPDRHTGDPADWWPTALAQARLGRAVVVLCGPSAARELPLPAARLGELDQPRPLDVTEGASS